MINPTGMASGGACRDQGFMGSASGISLHGRCLGHPLLVKSKERVFRRIKELDETIADYKKSLNKENT